MKRGDRTVANGAGCSEGAKVKTQEMSLETRKMCHFLLIIKTKFTLKCQRLFMRGFRLRRSLYSYPAESVHLAVRERKQTSGTYGRLKCYKQFEINLGG